MSTVPPRIIPLTKFYTCTDHLADRFERCGRQMGYRLMDSDETDAWQRALRAKVAEALGLLEMEPCEPVVTVTESIQLQDYRRERIELQTEPGVWTVLYALIPDDLKPGEKRPLILAPHGHCGGGKFATAGRTDIPAVAEVIAANDYAYGVEFVKQGWITFCPDARGFGERREAGEQGDTEDDFLTGSCRGLNRLAISLGQSVAGMWIWDLMQLIDYGLTRPEVDRERIAVAGLSGGGLQALYLAAVDERVKAAVTSGYFFGIKESLLYSLHCDCNYIPGMWKLADMGDLGALIAPRAFFVETGDADILNGVSGLANITTQLDITRAAYQALGAIDKVTHHVFHGPHKWDGTKSIPWLKQQLA